MPLIKYLIQWNLCCCCFHYFNLYGIDGLTSFKLEVGMELKDLLKVSTKATIIAHQNVDFYIQLYKAIFDTRRSSLFEALIDPSKLRGYSTNPMHRFDRTKCVSIIHYSIHYTFDNPLALSHIFNLFPLLVSKAYPLNGDQFFVFSKVYNATIEALNRGNAFATVINGGPGM